MQSLDVEDQRRTRRGQALVAVAGQRLEAIDLPNRHIGEDRELQQVCIWELKAMSDILHAH
jgi:hypothetical protein